ncbi:UNVERIFIED_CONTAM: hypothetical protein HDU68_003650, partial [Siphonaria sp. JEL0065]
MKYANERRLAIVTQQGNTGVFDEIVLSTSSIDVIQSFDEIAGILTCQAGCILEVLDLWLAERGQRGLARLAVVYNSFVMDPCMELVCVLRFILTPVAKQMHSRTILSMEIVKADGTILKDNSGYDLKHLFIGSEGRSPVFLFLLHASQLLNVAVLALPDFAAVQSAFKLARTELTEILSAFEFWDAACASIILSHISRNRLRRCPCRKRDPTRSTLVFPSIPEACSKDGAGGNLKYDISVPVEQIYDIVPVMRKRLEEYGLYDSPEAVGEKRVGRVVGFGHFGDGNLHLNITGTAWKKAVEKVVEPFVYAWVQSNVGSISAEHYE